MLLTDEIIELDDLSRSDSGQASSAGFSPLPMVRKAKKWIDAPSPAAPVSEVARTAVESRLEPVWELLEVSARHSDEDVEYVHQLRVSTRRAMAALSLFATSLPRRRTKWVNRRLKRIRRAAGEARDLDVLLACVQSSPHLDANSGGRAVVKQIAELREAAQDPIRDIYDHLKQRDFRERVGRLIRRIRWRGDSDSELSLAEAARSGLRPVLAEFFDAGSADLSDVDLLHQFRVAGKQLRYTMEVFAAAFPATFRSDLYPQIEDLQERLGKITDNAAAVRRFCGWSSEWTQPGMQTTLQSLIDGYNANLNARKQEFLRSWSRGKFEDLQAQFAAVMAPASTEEVA